jgi:glycosyltransferase involved in cell wall biosynthesis
MAGEVSVGLVTSTLDAARYLDETLRSIHDEPGNLSALEQHVLVDAGSRDATLEIASQYPVDVVHYPGSTLYEALNLGFECVRGDVLGYVNADDVYFPGALRRVAEHFARHPNCTWAYGGVFLVDETGNRLGRISPPAWLDAQSLVGLGWLCVPQPAMFLRRQTWARIKGFDTSYRFASDYDLVLRLLREVGSGARLPGEFADFRLHAQTLTREEGVLDEAVRVRRAHTTNRRAELLKGFALRASVNAVSPTLVVSKLLGRLPLARSLRMTG